MSIIHFNSFIELQIILERCFKDITSNNNKENENKYDENKIFYFENKKYIMEKMGLIFISVRLGLDNVSPEYFPSIKKLFTIKEFLGFIGGKKWTNSASYFFGFYDNFLLYLDPHFNNQTVENLNNDTITSYTNKTIYKLDIKTLKAAFTIGFLFRNLKEFNELLNFFKEQQKEENPCFSFTDKKVELEIKKDKFNDISDKDDF